MRLAKSIIKYLGLSSFFKKQFKQNVYIDCSKDYWEQRYVSQKTSGAGSYGRLAEFKAEVLNQFIVDHTIKDVIELGCGDGHQLTLTKFPEYTGYDVSEEAIARCQSIFKNDENKQFYSMFDSTTIDKKAELTISLDVIYHLVEDKVFYTYMERLFKSATRYVVIYSSNYNGYLARHVRCRQFTDWITKNVSDDWELNEYIKNKYPFDASKPKTTSMADFYIYKKIAK